MRHIIFIFSLITTSLCAAGSSVSFPSDEMCFKTFEGVTEANLYLLIKELGGPNGVEAYLKIQSADFVRFENLQGEGFYLNDKKAKFKQKHWKSKELSKKKTQTALSSEDVVPVKKNKVKIQGTKFKLGIYPDRGGHDYYWFSIGAKDEGVSGLALESRMSRHIKAFTDQKSTIYIVNPATGESIRFKLHDLKPFRR